MKTNNQSVILKSLPTNKKGIKDNKKNEKDVKSSASQPNLITTSQDNQNESSLFDNKQQQDENNHQNNSTPSSYPHPIDGGKSIADMLSDSDIQAILKIPKPPQDIQLAVAAIVILLTHGTEV